MVTLDRTTTADTMAPDVVGGEHMEARYYRSYRFIGTVLGTSLSLCAGYAAYLLPVGIISYINADLVMISKIVASTSIYTQAAECLYRT